MVSKVVGRPGRGARHRDFENWSMATIIMVLPLDSGKSVMNSMAMRNQGRGGVGRGMSLPAGRVHGTVAWVQAVHDKINLWMLVIMLGHRYFTFKR